MPLNPNIILQGQQANVMNALSQGNQAAAQTLQLRDQNKLRDLYAQQGAGIAAGDQSALNALAGIDPQAALGVQNTRLGMDNTRQTMDIRQQTADRLSREEQRAIQERAAQMSAAERAAEAAKIEDAVKMGLMIQTPEEWDRMAQQNAPELVGQFANREALAAKYMSVAEVLKSKAPPEPADEYGRYFAEETKAGRKPLSRIDYAQAKKGQGVSMTMPDGTTVQVGGPSGPPKLTVDAAKNSGFLIRTQDANEVLNDLEKQGLEFFQQNLDKTPMGLGNYGRSQDFQKFDQARRDFVNAILRRESGAVISDQEFENANIQYFPVPGDGPEVIAQKRRNRENAITGLRVGSGEGAAYVDSLKPVGENTPDPQQDVPNFSQMSDEELDAYIQENSQ